MQYSHLLSYSSFILNRWENIPQYRNTLLINEVEVLKKEAANILGNSFKNAINEIIQLAPESFNHIIQKSSRKEGVWEMDTLIRVSDIITSYNALSTLVSNARRTKINQCLKKIRQRVM